MVRSTRTVALALVSSVLVSPAFAQVSPEQVWQGWQKMGASYGQAIIADSVTRNGDTLVVSGMKISMDQDGATIDGGIDEVRFRDMGDGRVEVTMTDTYNINVNVPSEDNKKQEIVIALNQPGLTLIAAGSSARTEYTYNAPSIAMDMQFKEDGVMLADVDSTLTGLAGSYIMDTQSDATMMDSALVIDGVAFTMKAGDASSGATATGMIAGMKLATNGNFLDISALDDMAQALRDGFTAKADFTYGKGSFTVDAVDMGKATKIVASGDTGSFQLDMGDGGLRYELGGTGVAMAISGADIPFPEVKVSYGEASFEFLMPLLASDAPTDFSFVSRLVDLTVSDEIWGVFDPTATLPRDPATLIVDTKGKIKLTADLVDEAAMAELGDSTPAELHALDLTDLTLKFAGAEVNGTGSMSFDNADLESFDGIPAPTGKVDLVIRGGNGLLDKLVAMGLVPQDQAMGARMMIAMFAKPGDGPDVLNSSLEFRDKGFFANGQRLK